MTYVSNLIAMFISLRICFFAEKLSLNLPPRAPRASSTLGF